MSKLLSNNDDNNIDNATFDTGRINLNNAYDNLTEDIVFSGDFCIESSSSTATDNTNTQYERIPFYDYENYEYFAIELIQKDLSAMQLENRSGGNNRMNYSNQNQTSLMKSAQANVYQSSSHIVYDSDDNIDLGLSNRFSPTHTGNPADKVTEGSAKNNLEPSFIIYDEQQTLQNE
jgi:hypothetical protein